MHLDLQHSIEWPSFVVCPMHQSSDAGCEEISHCGLSCGSHMALTADTIVYVYNAPVARHQLKVHSVSEGRMEHPKGSDGGLDDGAWAAAVVVAVKKNVRWGPLQQEEPGTASL